MSTCMLILSPNSAANSPFVMEIIVQRELYEVEF